jgi:hypothetical protein
MMAAEAVPMTSSVSDLHNVVDNIDSRILKLEKKCPTDWGPEKIDLEKRIRHLESKCDMIWAELSPDDLE